MSYLNELNEAQRAAVMYNDGPSLVIAGAGSGKTRVLTYKIAHLIKSGAPAQGILALTFTNKAAREMKERIVDIVGRSTARYLWMGTFHSIFARILRKEAESLGYTSNFIIYDAADSKSAIKSIINDLKLDDKVYKTNEVLGRISSAKNNLVTPIAYKNNMRIIEADQASRKPLIAEIYEIYTRRCKAADAMDFDDLLLNTNILFRDFPEVLQSYQQRFSHILVDEYQDTNYSQYLIVKKLSEAHQKLCVVGDDAQSIYSFRGAKIENILNFQNDYKNYKLFKLEQNYRSTQTIVNAANSIIKKNKGQIPKKVFSKQLEGEVIRVFKAYSDAEEGYMVANDILDAHLQRHDSFSDFAVLYRTNAQSRIFEEAFRKRNIPHKIYGGLSFYQRKEIKDLLAYFRLTINTKDGESLKRIINYPARGIGKTTLDKIVTTANENNLSIWEVLTDLQRFNLSLNAGTIKKLKSFVALVQDFRAKEKSENAFDTAVYIANKAGIINEFKTSRAPENISKYENIEELLNAIQDFTSSQQEEEGNEIPRLREFLEDVSLLTDQDNDSDEDQDKVTLMTIHSAKGLEFSYVYLVGLEEDLFPSQMSKNSVQDLEEERRLFYVAVTRAKEKATISYALNRYRWGKPVFCNPSRFISEIDPSYVLLPDGFDGKSQQNQTPFTSSFQEQKPNFIKTTAAAPKPAAADFTPSTVHDIKEGATVEHSRFGIGKVLSIDGVEPNLKAIVSFESAGEKNLLLKFAKLKVIH